MASDGGTVEVEGAILLTVAAFETVLVGEEVARCFVLISGLSTAGVFVLFAFELFLDVALLVLFAV